MVEVRAQLQAKCPIRPGDPCSLCVPGASGPRDRGLVYLVMSDPDLRDRLRHIGRSRRCSSASTGWGRGSLEGTTTGSSTAVIQAGWSTSTIVSLEDDPRTSLTAINFASGTRPRRIAERTLAAQSVPGRTSTSKTPPAAST